MQRIGIAFLLILLTTTTCFGAEIRGKVVPAGEYLHVEINAFDTHGKFIKLPKPIMLNAATGVFKCINIPEGKCNIYIHPNGMRYAAAELRDIKIGAKTKIDLGVIKLAPSAWITGTVEPAGADINVDVVGQTKLLNWDIRDIGESGQYEIDGLVPGDYIVTVESRHYARRSFRVYISKPMEYKLEPVKLEPLSEISGILTLIHNSKSTGKYERPPQVVAMRTAGRKMEDEPYGYITDNELIEGRFPYVISDIHPGRYDLAIEGSGILVIGDSSLPKESSTLESDSATVREAVTKMGEAFIKHDARVIKEGSADTCNFDSIGSPGDCSDLLEVFFDKGTTFGKRRFIIIRTDQNSAVVWTSLKCNICTRIEKWAFIRTDRNWKLNSYIIYQPLGIFEDDRALYSISKKERNMPEPTLIITDDPKLTNIEIKRGGELSSGHDWTLEIP